MRTETITKTLNIYKYDELKEDIREKVYKDFEAKIIDIRFEFLLDDMRMFLEDTYNLHDFKIEYSLCYCQGDGVCFYGNTLLNYKNFKNGENMNVFEKMLTKQLSREDRELLLEYLNCGYNFYITKKSYYYSHKNTCDIEEGYYYNDDEELQDKVNDLTAKISHMLKDKTQEICDELEHFGYAQYEVEEEEVLDFIESNGYEFLEDGSIY